MRISTSLMYESGITSIQQRQSELVKLQQQIATGRRMLTPADDPIAAAAALDAAQAKALNAQLRVNADTATARLGQEEQALAELTDLLQDVRALAINAGNPVLRNEDRASLAAEIEGRYQELLGIANRHDGNGNYIFAGHQSGTRPFTETAPGVIAYAGDEGRHEIQIGTARTVAVSDSGSAIFLAVQNGNGTFETTAGANTGSAVISPGNVLDPAKWNNPANSGDFSLRFHVNTGVVPPVTTYDIVDVTGSTSLLTGAAPVAGPHLRTYTPGSAIALKTQMPPDTNSTAFDFGAEVVVTGAPADGDTFAIEASTRQDMFATVHELASALRVGYSGTPGSTASFQNRLSGVLVNLDNALDNALAVRTGVGIRMREVDAARAVSEELAVQHEQDLSRLQDLDYAQAISRLSLNQTTLEAAQKTFVNVTGLKLFDYL